MPTTAMDSAPANAVDHDAELAIGVRAIRRWCLSMPKPGEREPGEHTDRVQADERVELRLEDDDQQDRDHGEHEDAVGEREPVAALGQLTRQERIARRRSSRGMGTR